MTTIEQPNNDKYWWAAIVTLVLVFLFHAFMCRAQRTQVPTDTIPLSFNNVKGIRVKQTKSSEKYYIVYNFGEFADVLPTNRTTVDYISICKDANVKPSLGLIVKNNRFVRIVKLDHKVLLK